MAEAARVVLVGDVSLAGDYVRRYGGEHPRWNEPFREVRQVFEDADLAIGNLESPLFISSTPKKKRNLLAAPPEAASALGYLGFRALGLANNHITDQGVEGITATRAALRDVGIAAYGAGEDLGEAGRPEYLVGKDLQFALLAYVAQDDEVGAEIAGEASGGCVGLSMDRVATDIALARTKATHVVVSLHWGYQFDRYPSPDQVTQAHRLIDMGALIVHGHHPHVLQGVERYRSGLILYSLGNFFFPDFTRADGQKFRFPRVSRETAVVECQVDETGVVEFNTAPVFVDSHDRIRFRRGRAAVRARRFHLGLANAIDAPEYRDLWSDHHDRTERWRDLSQEGSLKLYEESEKLWRRTRARGLVGTVLHFRPRHVEALLRLLARHVRVLWHRKRTPSL